jgi:hypothetical protein
MLACAGPRTSGALWALDEAHLEEDLIYRQTEQQRAAIARSFQLQVADEALASEAARLRGLLRDCPGQRRPLELSSGNRVRDAIRVRGDGDRRLSARQLGVADWFARRAAATGSAALCERARQALDGQPSATPRSDLATLVSGLPTAEVDAEPQAAGAEVVDGSVDPVLAVAEYATGVVDRVRGPAPLVAYLGAVYGGTVSLPGARLSTDIAPEEIVDALVAASADWEPDGLYSALLAATRLPSPSGRSVG